MRRLCRLMTVVVMVAGLLGCGSTTDEDSLVLQFLGFDGEGINQADQILGSEAEVDVVPGSCCTIDSATGLCTETELFTQTTANAMFRNNQALDITIDSYEVEIIGSSLGVFEGHPGNQVVMGRRCDIDVTRPCATDVDCSVAGIPGTCRPTVSFVSVLLFDFSTKNLISPDAVPFGRTFPVEVRFVGTDLAGETWRATADFQARFDNFDNCGVTQ